MSKNRISINLWSSEPIAYREVSKGQGRDGQVKKASWKGKNISINIINPNGNVDKIKFNKGSLIDFINHQLNIIDPTAKKLKKGGLFGCASKNSEIRKVFQGLTEEKPLITDPEVQASIDAMGALATSDLHKIQNLAGQNIAADLNQLNPNHVAMLQIPEKTITSGHGEYIVFLNQENYESANISEEDYEKVYEIFNKYSPVQLINDGEKEKLNQRYDHILTEVKEINPHFEIAFVPRTLYELTFLRKTIQEDIKHGETCPKGATLFHNHKHMKETDKIENHRKKCWHLCSFDNPDNEDHQNVRDIAFRLNKVLVKALKPSHEGLSYEEFLSAAEREISFYEKYQELSNEQSKVAFGALKLKIYEKGGPTEIFQSSMTPKAVQILRNAIALECSALAQTSFLLYRGAQYKNDAIERTEEMFNGRHPDVIPQALSYGTSLFAGILRDRGASAFFYAKNDEKDAFVLHIPFVELADSPFYIPKALHSVWQLSAYGEIFHPRAKVWDVPLSSQLGGVTSTIEASALRKKIFQPGVSKSQAIDAFRAYHGKIIHLKICEFN